MIPSKSIIFLLILISLVLFLVGINVGKEVEKTNQKIVITPTKIIEKPTVTSIPIAYETFIQSECGVTFLYPKNLKESNISSGSASLLSAQETIKVTCNTKDVADFTNNKEKYKDEGLVTLNNQKINLYSQDGISFFLYKNPYNGKSIIFEVTKNLQSLVLKTVEFSK
jgi:hypothetical protein